MQKVLLIDDLKSDLLLIKSIIETNMSDVEVLTANTALAGLQIAKSQIPDAIILDIFMPEINGYEVARRLKADRKTSAIPIVMLTGNLEDENVMAKGLDSGADVFLYKPVNRPELLAQLRAVFRLKKAEENHIKDRLLLEQKEKEIDYGKSAFKGLIERLPVAYVIHSNGVVLYANQKAAELVGIDSPDKVIGKNITDFVHTDYLDTMLVNLRRLMEGEIDEIKTEAIYKDIYGNPVYVFVNAAVTYFENKKAFQVLVENINEKKIRENERNLILKQLQMSEKLSKSGSWRYNVPENKVYFSDNLLRIHGITREEFDNKPETAMGFIVEEDQPKIAQMTGFISDPDNVGKQEAVEYRIKDREGNIKFVIGTAQAVLEKNKKVMEIFGTLRDITDEKRAEAKLRESEERFGITFDLNPDPISITDLVSGKYIAVNQAFVEQTGFSKEEIMGKSTLELDVWAIPGERKRLMMMLGENKGEVKNFETSFKIKDGSVMSALLSAKIISVDGNKYLLSIVKNIEVLKENQRIVEAERQKLRKYIDIAQVMLVVLDRLGNVALINNKGCEILGYEEKNIIGKNWFDNFIPKGSVEKVKTIFVGLMKGEEKLYEYYDNPVVNARGEERLIAWHNALIYDEKGAITGILSSGDDVTEVRKQEEELKNAREKALESDRLKSAFLANMSHEIRTPMNAILGFTQLLKDKSFSEEEKLEFLNIITKSGTSLLELINDIIDISSIEAGQVKIEKEPVDVHAVVKEVKDLFSLQAKEKGLELISESLLDDKQSVIITDGLKVKQVLINLVGNAIKFTHKGYVKISVQPEKEFLKFSVEDTGTGIAEEDQLYVFDRFRKVENKKSKVVKGSGLGLSISKAYVEMLGGAIFLSSKLNKGTTFYFTLPFEISYKKEKSVKTENMENDLQTNTEKMKKLLIAEDDIYVIKFLKMALKNLNIQIKVVNNGVDAVNAVKEDPEIGLILMDVKMPILDGLKATRQIKKFKPGLPIIAQTAFALSGDEEKALEAGCDDYITKPIRRVELIEKVKHYLNL